MNILIPINLEDHTYVNGVPTAQPGKVLGGSVTDLDYYDPNTGEFSSDTVGYWDSTVTYSAGQRVVDSVEHIVYQNLVNNNLNVRPYTNPTKWLRINKTALWAPFDSVSSSKGSGPDVSGMNPIPQLEYTIKPGQRITNMYLGEIFAESVTVELYQPAGTLVHTQTVEFPATSDILRAVARRVVLSDFTLHGDPEVKIKLTPVDLRSQGLGYKAVIGEIVVGATYFLGVTRPGLSYGITDYSKKDTDEFGNTSLAVRNYANKFDAQVDVKNAYFNMVYELLQDNRATPCVWLPVDYVGSFDATSFALYGTYNDFTLTQGNSDSLLSLQVEGMN